jgi:hypothetical protein
MTAEQIKALSDLELLTKYELYRELGASSVRDVFTEEQIAIELDRRGL